MQLDIHKVRDTENLYSMWRFALRTIMTIRLLRILDDLCD